jgi:hypothetical protein
MTEGTNEDNEVYPFNFGIRLRKTPITAVINNTNFKPIPGDMPKIVNGNVTKEIHHHHHRHRHHHKNKDSDTTTSAVAVDTSDGVNDIINEQEQVTVTNNDSSSSMSMEYITDPDVNTHLYFHCLANDKCRKCIYPRTTYYHFYCRCCRCCRYCCCYYSAITNISPLTFHSYSFPRSHYHYHSQVRTKNLVVS